MPAIACASCKFAVELQSAVLHGGAAWHAGAAACQQLWAAAELVVLLAAHAVNACMRGGLTCMAAHCVTLLAIETAVVLDLTRDGLFVGDVPLLVLLGVRGRDHQWRSFLEDVPQDHQVLFALLACGLDGGNDHLQAVPLDA